MKSALVVIPTLNESLTIDKVLKSLCLDLDSSMQLDSLMQLKPPMQLRIQCTFVVVDGGSQDGTQAIVEQLAKSRKDMHLLHNPKKLQSAGVNLAVKHFGQEADFLIRCDAHAIYPPQYIARLLATLEFTKADAVVVPMDSIGKNCLQKSIAWVSDTLVGSGGSAHRGGKQSGFVDHGHHAAFRTSRFLQMGGYADHAWNGAFEC
jgi:succinoglycan biosynthesis protein ExoA